MDPYQVLGVAPDASTDEIHGAYRDLARRLHPDTGSADAAEMATVNDAWRTLSDPARRATYDAAAAAAGARPHSDRAPARNAGYSDVDGGAPLRSRVHRIIVAMLALILVVFVIIVLVGFGRVGVAPRP